jgi:hypothetical protein
MFSRCERDIIIQQYTQHGDAAMYAVFSRPDEESKGMRISIVVVTYAKAQQIAHPRPHIQTFSRARSSRSSEDAADREPGPRDDKLLSDLMGDIDNGDMPLDQRLEDMGLDAKEYKAYGKVHLTRSV